MITWNIEQGTYFESLNITCLHVPLNISHKVDYPSFRLIVSSTFRISNRENSISPVKINESETDIEFHWAVRSKLHFNTTKHCNNQFLPLVVVDRALRIIWT